MSVTTRSIAPEVARHLDALPEICRRHHVLRLDLFGSAAREDFDPARSDVDVLVAFHSAAPRTFAAYFDFKEELEALFGRHVDVIEDGSVKNPYRLASIEASRLLIFP